MTNLLKVGDDQRAQDAIVTSSYPSQLVIRMRVQIGEILLEQ